MFLFPRTLTMVVEFYYPSVVDVGGTPRGIMPILRRHTEGKLFARADGALFVL